MTGMTDYWARKILDHSTGKTDIGALPVVYLGFYTTAPSDAGGGTEVSGGSYARLATTGANWNAAAGSAPSSVSNAQVLTWAAATASWGSTPLVAIGAFDAPTSGDLLWWDYLGNFPWLPFTCTAASPGVLTVPAHGFANGDTVVVSAEYGGTLPTTAGSWAGLLSVANATTDSFTLGVTTTASGSGSLRKVLAVSINTPQAPSFAAGTLTLTQA